MAEKNPTILIIIGITGDLAQRKLLPAVGTILAAGVAPEKLRILGITRRGGVAARDVLPDVDNARLIAQRLELFQMDLAQPSEYRRLGERLEELERELGGTAQKLYYLAVPPQVSQPIIEQLGASGLSAAGSKLLLEKPFGVDLGGAQELVEQIGRYFRPEQVYRIDHYLAKEMAQNLIIFREDNALFRQTWNKDFIASVEIVAAEAIGIEGRAAFYEQTGALRDVVQSHLLQLAALTLMDVADTEGLQDVPSRRLAALQQLTLDTGSVRRAQYRGYREEVNNPDSMVETFVSMTLRSVDPRWEGVPIRIVTGKALAAKTTEIRMTYGRHDEREPDLLTLRLQPDEGVELCLWAKAPGYDRRSEQRPLKFAYGEGAGRLPEAYEQVLLDAINSDHRLFVTGDEVLEAWRIIEPAQRAWEMDSTDLITYEPGSNPEQIGK